MILIENLVFSNQKIGGISVVWYELVRRLAKDADLRVLFLEYEGAQRNFLRRTIEIPDSMVLKGNSFLLRIRRFFNIRFNRRKPFIFHSSSYRIARNKEAINFVTVHDFIYFISKPETIRGICLKWVHCRQIARALKRADYIICVSNNTRHDLIKFFPGISREKLHVIHNGVSDDFCMLHDLEFSQLPYPKNSFALFVGSRSRYKNFGLAVEAVALTNLSLVVVGKELDGDEQAFIDKFLPAGRYKCLKGISNASLNQLYNGAFCLLYISSYEGFGIPVIEAQRAGCPVIAYNASSIPEIIGETPLLINELSAQSIQNCLNRLQNNEFRSRIILNGIRNAENFSWDKSYSRIKQLYLEAEVMSLNLQ